MSSRVVNDVQGRIFKVFAWKNVGFRFFLKAPRKLKHFPVKRGKGQSPILTRYSRG